MQEETTVVGTVQGCGHTDWSKGSSRMSPVYNKIPEIFSEGYLHYITDGVLST